MSINYKNSPLGHPNIHDNHELPVPNSGQIIQSIQNMTMLDCIYDGHTRKIEPHLCGRSKTGRILLRCFQIEGSSTSGTNFGWKLFDLKKIHSLRVTDEQFFYPRPQYNPDDSAMIEIYARLE